MLKKIFTFFMLLATLAIHAAEPIIMTNTSLDLKLSLYPAESSEEGAIVFWTNKGEVERWSVTTASGKNYEMAVKSRYVVKQDGITKYMVKLSLDKDTFIKVFKNDLPVSVSFQIKGFANDQYATIDLPQGIKNHFASELENFNRPKQTPQTTAPSDVIKFMGIPLWGDVDLFIEKLKTKGFVFIKSGETKEGIKNYVYKGRFWEWNNVECWIETFANSNEISMVYIEKDLTFTPSYQLSDLMAILKDKYGKGRLMSHVDDEISKKLVILWELKNGGVEYNYSWISNTSVNRVEVIYYTPRRLKEKLRRIQQKQDAEHRRQQRINSDI